MNYFIFGNIGDNTVALMRWAHECALENVTVLNVDTGWAAECWAKRVAMGQRLARDYGFSVQTLQPPQSFPEQIAQRGAFPSVKFQWCAGFVKGLAFLNWADIEDPQCQATVLMGSRRADSRARFALPEFEHDNEHFGGRTVWYPLFDTDDQQRDQLIAKTGCAQLNHRSLECHPCVFNSPAELVLLSDHDNARIAQLHRQLEKPIIQQQSAVAGMERFDLGCGAKYGCGE